MGLAGAILRAVLWQEVGGAAASISTRYPLQPEIALAHFSMGPGMHSPRAERAQGPREPQRLGLVARNAGPPTEGWTAEARRPTGS